MILLTSNGLSNPSLINIVKNESSSKKLKNALIITTADNVYKNDNWHIERLSNELKSCGLSVDLFDFDTDDLRILDSADVIELNGGNPYYLLDRLKKNNMKSFLHKFVLDGKILIGISAGSLVLQKNINIIDVYTQEMNFLNLKDLSGMGLVDVQIIPHYSKFLAKFDRFEERCIEYEKKNHLSVTRLNDGEGIIYNNNQTHNKVE